jgi:Epoxide hydrolase N terminus
MNAIKLSEEINRGRRRFIGGAATSIAAVGIGSLLRADPATAVEGDAIRSFRINIPEEQLVDLRRRIAATRWPDKETVADESQGAQLAKLQQLVRYWGSGYDWRKAEARLNALPQFITTIDGVDIHFIHVRSRHPNVLPIIITHGWPGSVIEQLKIIDPLTNPTAHGGSAEDAFDVVIPSLPGYGFSARPTGTGWDPASRAEIEATISSVLTMALDRRRRASSRPFAEARTRFHSCRDPCHSVVRTFGTVGVVCGVRLDSYRRRSSSDLRLCGHRGRRGVLTCGRRGADGTRLLQQSTRL